MTWHRFVAIGDSFTEGIDDPAPDGNGFRGWADLVAGELAAACRRETDADLDPASTEGFRYANLAVRGRRFNRVVEEQVPVALSMTPDLVSFAAGGNDVLLRQADMTSMMARLEKIVMDFRDTGSTVILFAVPDVTSRLPRRRRILPRLTALNAETVRIAAAHGAVVVDMWGDDEFRNPRLWSQDRLHLGVAGHRRVAALTLSALGLTPDPSWLEPAAPVPRQSWYAARKADAQWIRTYYLPWLRRRLAGRSTGDLITAKRPALMPVTDHGSG